MPPPMPITMRGTGKLAAPVAKGKPMRARYFPGKAPGAEVSSGSEGEDEDAPGANDAADEEEDAIPAESTAPRIQQPSNVLGEVPAEASESEYETDEEGSSEDEPSEEEEEAPRRVLPKPIFLSKSQRATAPATDQSGLDEQERRKAESRKRIEEQIRLEAIRQEEEALARDEGQAEVDDTDDLNPEAEQQAWRLRELQRIARERQVIEAREAEREEVERRLAMPEDERLKEDMERVEAEKAERAAARGQMGFMQKYYHKGAFYQEALGDRDFSAPVEAERVDKMAMPKMMQVRNLDDVGKRGRTKYTHLGDQDTSAGDRAWQASGNKRLLSQMGGMKDELDQRKRKAT
ncbi:splicing factor, Prp19-binding domain-domain-containing protein [Protomyces lactucae-debilis]|uniref:Splicing factor, Prp19-binding domain-domain-containing protein n=1 Tax=Protomyces lactucae-debilis TaxID=2754530 RepID=A0A1Y2FBE5_PROLT|nr:splicing factor, Prp19-binding domain-containing protein [Protomyces lactucae-debilis]ORY80947.1 splicing factor, Prp19-binding domain-domain-containing protein [Protomyces lactucae-debilis]